MKKTILTIHPDRCISTIPKAFFGHFIEHMRDCVDPGLWAELLESRGFENPESEDCPGVSMPWKAVGENINYAIDSEWVYAPHFSQRMVCSACEADEGIEQSGLHLFAQESYEGSVWAYSETQMRLRVRLQNHLRKTIYESYFDMEPHTWNHFTYTFEIEETDDNGIIQFLLDTPGVMWLDQMSLKPQHTVDGIWPQVFEQIRQLSPSILRYPGGCVADCYFWQDGIGPRDQRPSWKNLHWGGVEQNHFGTDEYIALCRKLGCQPLICVNFGSSTPEDAANWVEYCNGSQDTVYGRMRAENGHPEPYQVQYWEIGNETFGTWEIGHCTEEEYVARYQAFAAAMKKKDSSIRLLVCGGDGGSLDQTWNKKVLPAVRGMADVLSLHVYAPMSESKPYDDDILYLAAAAASEKTEKMLRAVCFTMEKTGVRLPLGITEWNCNYGAESVGDREQTLEGAIVNAGFLHTFLRHGNSIEMCNFSDIVNGWPGGLLRSSHGYAFGTATYHLLKLYAQSHIKTVIKCEYESETYETRRVGNIEPMQGIPYIDILCCQNINGECLVFAINRHLTEQITLQIPGWNILNGQFLWSESILDKNTLVQQEKICAKKVVCKESEINLLPHSVYLLKVALK